MRYALLMSAVILLVFTWFSYLMASVGAPQQLWLWRDILGVL